MAKRTKKNEVGPSIRQLHNGDYILLQGISPALVDQIRASVKDPAIPTFIAEDGSELQNPNDPLYQLNLDEATALRDRRVLQAIITFGMELCDENGEPIDPPDDKWEFRLKMIGVNWRKEVESIVGPISNPDELAQARTDAYLMFVAVSAFDMELIGEVAGAPELAQADAEAMFRSQA